MSDDVDRGLGVRLLMDDVTEPTTMDFALPTGTVTFLLTDVEGSSRRWENAPEAMEAAIPRHYAVLDECIARHRGVRPVEQGEGDSVVGAFSRASDAVAAALEGQRALAAEPWPAGGDLRVRMAIHTGEAQLRDSGNYFGRTVIRCARLRAIGHGGQVLISDATAGLVADRLPPGAELVDLGLHRLKDLGRPERVRQLTSGDLAANFPPLRSLDAFRHNLPVQLTPLVGRAAETTEVALLVAEHRLVTLTGSGGVGKTRLALATAAESLERFAGGGVWLVELAGTADPAGVASTALAALGAHQAPGVSLVEQVADQLGPQPSLLVLDNCEHLLAGCADFVAQLLSANGAVTVLATSRQPLDVPGEVSWRVPSLDTPPARPATAVSTLSQYDAVRLFIDRARRARPSFAVTDANAPAVAEICYRLDGIPLALELAAARCRQLSAERIARDLDDRFRLLTGGARTVLPRHQTLAASIDWSHDRLDPDEAIVFRRLAVFAGAFPLEAAEAIVAGGDIEAAAVFDLVSRLVDKSLVAVDDGPAGEPRYRLLESLRAYGLDRLRAAGELDDRRQVHAHWCLHWLECRWAALHTDPVVAEVDALHDNFRAALAWSLDTPAIGLPLLRHLGRAWQAGGRPEDAMAAVDRLLTDDNAQSHPGQWAQAGLEASILVLIARSWAQGVTIAKHAERLATEAGLAYEAAVARWLHKMTLECDLEVRDLAHEHGDPYTFALAAFNAVRNGGGADPSAPISSLDTDEILAACRGSTLVTDEANVTRAIVARATGDLRHCIELNLKLFNSPAALTVRGAVVGLSMAALLASDENAAQAAVDVGERRLGDRGGFVEGARTRLGLLHGGPSQANPDLRPDNNYLALPTLHSLAKEAIAAGQPSIAVETVRTLAVSAPTRAVCASIEAAVSGDEDTWHEALQSGADHGLRLIVVDALEGLAAAASRSESWAECLRLYGAAQRLRDECEYRWRFDFEQTPIDEALTAARAGLDAQAAQVAEAEGRALPWREAVQYASRARGERKRPRHGWASLTPTEEQVLALVAEGLTNPQIGERLLMGRATVKTHLEHIFAKVGVTSRTELAAQAARRHP